MHAQIVLFDGFDPLDAIAPFEVLAARSDAIGGELVVEMVTAEGPRLVTIGTLHVVYSFAERDQAIVGSAAARTKPSRSTTLSSSRTPTANGLPGVNQSPSRCG